MVCQEGDLCYWPADDSLTVVCVYGFICCMNCGELKNMHVANKCLFDTTAYAPCRMLFADNDYFRSSVKALHERYTVFIPGDSNYMDCYPLTGPICP